MLTSKQAENRQSDVSTTESTLILCGYSRELANYYINFRCGHNHPEESHEETSFLKRREYVELYGWEPYKEWFTEIGCTDFRNWWQVIVGGVGVPLWKLPPENSKN